MSQSPEYRCTDLEQDEDGYGKNCKEQDTSHEVRKEIVKTYRHSSDSSPLFVQAERAR